MDDEMNKKIDFRSRGLLNLIILLSVSFGAFSPINLHPVYANTLIFNKDIKSGLPQVALQGTLLARSMDQFLPDGSITHKEQYFLENKNTTIVIQLPSTNSISLQTLKKNVGMEIIARGNWSPEKENTGGLFSDSPILKVDSIHVLSSTPSKSLPSISGSKPFITILCRFPEDTGEPTYPKEWFETMVSNTYPGMDDFWREVSYGAIDLIGSNVVGWYTLPKTRADYTIQTYWTECAALADPDVDFTQYFGVNVIIDKRDPAALYASGGETPITLGFDGSGELQLTETSTTTSTPYYILGILEHEVGHAFGMVHSSGPYGDQYDSGWDVMSGYGSGLKCDLKTPWIPADRIYILNTGESASVTIERLAQPPLGNYIMAKIPINGSATQYYTVESRKFVGYDAFLQQKESSEAVLIQKIDREYK